MKKWGHRSIQKFVQEHIDKGQSWDLKLGGFSLEDMLLQTILPCLLISIIVIPINTNVCFMEADIWDCGTI